MDKAYEGFLKSQLIWSGRQFGMTQFELPSPIDVSNLPPVPTNRRLGHQAEFVFLQLLHSCSQYEVLAHSIQLIQDKRTLGELDYIIRNLNTREVLHVELTYKFYILDSTISDPINQLIGPNRKDAFVQKLNKTRDKQMPLLYSEPSRTALSKLDLDSANIRQFVTFYAHVFVPYGDRSFDIDDLNVDCVAGYWVSRAEFSLAPFEHYIYYHPNKYEWLHIPHHERPWKSYHEIVDDMAPSLAEDRSVMLWKKDLRGGDSAKIERVFVCKV